MSEKCDEKAISFAMKSGPIIASNAGVLRTRYAIHSFPSSFVRGRNELRDYFFVSRSVA